MTFKFYLYFYESNHQHCISIEASSLELAKQKLYEITSDDFEIVEVVKST